MPACWTTRAGLFRSTQPMSIYDPTTETAVESNDENEPAITTHVELESQGAQTYFRCSCGREAMRKRDLRSEAHKEECDA